MLKYINLKFNISLIFIVFTSIIAYSQPKSFSKKPEVYILELKNYMISTKEPAAIESVEKFEKLWNKLAYIEDHQDIIIKISDEMLLNKMRITPDFDLYIRTLISAKDTATKLSDQKFDQWLKATLPISRSGAKPLRDLLITSKGLFEENCMYLSESKRWYANSKEYKFIFSNGKNLIEYGNITLTCKTNDDKIIIKNTKGTYDMDKKIWTGVGGIIDWTRVGFPEKDVFATIKTYKIDMNKAEISTDSAMLTDKLHLANPILGKLTDIASFERLMSNQKDFLDSKFPKFYSYQNDIPVDKFAQGQAKYIGGFGLEGNTLLGIGTASKPSSFGFYYKNKLKLKVESESFVIKQNKISAEKSSITIFTDSGTIFHPQILFNYNLESKKLILTRGQEGLENAPFFDTDHQLEFYVDVVEWALDQNTIHFDMKVNEATARFESNHYFRDFNYEKVQGVLSYHPLERMQQYSYMVKSREFTLNNYALGTGSTPDKMKNQIYELADLGYIYYNPTTDIIKMKNKVFHHVNSHLKVIDYDVIRFRSIIGARSNAYLNLVNNDFVIEGVPAFNFSDSQTVVAYPREQIVTIQNKRKINFGGKLTAGWFDFYSTNFNFDYLTFKIHSDKMDSLRLYFPDTLSGNTLLPVTNLLKDISGTIYIDKPNNKSGLSIKNAEYPIFVSEKPSKISYQKKSLFNGQYNENDFYFKVDPFTIDSMDNFTVSGLKFPGTFVSAGILPEFKYEAKIMRDYSLGFQKASPPEGFKMYGNKGNGKIDVTLDDKGLTAKGEIDYLGAKIKSNSIILLPDSMNSNTELFTIEESAKYPKVKAVNINNTWVPKKDILYINTLGHQVDMFKDGQKFTGNLVLTPKQLSGRGVLDFQNAKLTSRNMLFQTNATKADTSMIEIKGIDNEKIAFVSTNVKADINFNTKIADFKSNIKGNLTEFATNQFAASMDEYKWEMDNQIITLTKSNKLSNEESYFISRNPGQDALKFQCPKAVFDIKLSVIKAENVPYIDVADSRVFPSDGKVVINKDADINILTKSKLLAARENKYHQLYDCNIKVLGRKALGGNGKYEYKDKPLSKQIIYFDKMRVMSDSTIMAAAYISDSLNIKIYPKMQYKGSVELNSNNPFLNWNGYVKALHDFAFIKTTWVRFKDRPDPKQIIVDVSKPKNEENKYLSVSLNYALDTSLVYPTFFNLKRKYVDPEYTNDTGILIYNEVEDAFYSGNKDKILNGDKRGSVLKLDNKTKTISTEGKLNLGFDLPILNPILAGRLSKGELDSSYKLDAIMALDILLPKDAYTRMLAVITEAGGSASGIPYNDPEFQNALAELITNDKKLDKILTKAKEIGELDIKDEVERKMIFGETHFNYSPKKRSWVSNQPIGFSLLNGQQINKTFDSRMQITTKRSGVRMTIYIQISPYDWFYFDYFRGNMIACSTDKEFNEIIRDKFKEVTKDGYFIRLGTARTVEKFVKAFDDFKDE